MSEIVESQEIDQDGSEEQPLLVAQQGYGACHHGILSPQPKPGQHYRVTMFLDFMGYCPDCVTRRKQKVAEKKSRTGRGR